MKIAKVQKISFLNTNTKTLLNIYQFIQYQQTPTQIFYLE